MNYEKEIKYWLKSAKHDLEAAKALFEKEKYDWCLFLAHLVLEKTLKAFYVRDTLKMPPPIHNLEVLVERTKLELGTEEIKFLREVNKFNIATRYPDEKFEFYKRCNKEFTENYFSKIKEFYRWLLKRIR